MNFRYSIAGPDIKTSPRDCDLVAFNSDLSFIKATERDGMLRSGVAHELGHCLGVQHHGDSQSSTTLDKMLITDAIVEVLDTRGESDNRVAIHA